MTFKFTSIKSFAEMGCYTENAIRQKIKKNQWVLGTHYIKSPDKRIQLNLEEIQKWIESTQA
mgnify:CR=1 FL=1